MSAAPLRERVAVVTGSSRGIGLAHARHLASLGAAVIVNGRYESGASAAAELIRSEGGIAVPISGSAADDTVAAALVDAALVDFGRLDILVANAGLIRDAEFGSIAAEDWDQMVEVNLTGVFRLVQRAWPAMIAQDYGRVILTTSAGALFGGRGIAAYAAAKAGLGGLLAVLRQETAGTGIRVNAIAPLAVTGMATRPGTGSRAIDAMGDLFSRLHTDHISRLVAVLADSRCPADGRMFSVAGGRVAEIFAAETRGWSDPDADGEVILEHWHEIVSREGSLEPRSILDELTAVRAGLAGGHLDR